MGKGAANLVADWRLVICGQGKKFGTMAIMIRGHVITETPTDRQTDNRQTDRLTPERQKNIQIFF